MVENRIVCCLEVGILLQNFTYIAAGEDGVSEIITVNDVEYDSLPQTMLQYAYNNDIHKVEIYGAKILTEEVKREMIEITNKEYNNYNIKIETKER